MKVLFGDRIRTLRRKASMTQMVLAQKLGVSPSTVGMYEQNRRTPDNETMLKLCDIFDVSPDYFLGRSPSPRSFAKQHDVSDMLDEFTKKLSEQEGLMFDGNPLNDEERMQILEAIQIVSKIASNIVYENGGNR